MNWVKFIPKKESRNLDTEIFVKYGIWSHKLNRLVYRKIYQGINQFERLAEREQAAEITKQEIDALLRGGANHW